ncbi:MAG TPA: outer membrane lipoprotein carrier protein LolA [Opitutaceae bacterium]|nr:outer membrane lipoprotein carrier protein LolA [Opitutaceae bacterium]
MAPHPPAHRTDPLPLAGGAARPPASLGRLLLLAAALAGAALPAAASAALPPLRAIGPGDAYFSDLFRSLGRQGAVRSAFAESRWFPFRTEPVTLRGELRFSPGLGLSLHYTAPEERTVIFDSAGLLVRAPGGGGRAMPADPHVGELGPTLLAIFRFDEAGIHRAFQVRGAHAGAAWEVEFTPRSAEALRWIGVIRVWGESGWVTRLEFRRSGSQRVQIDLTSATVPAVFSAEERRRYFR